MLAYSFVASKDGHAFAAKSLWLCISAFGNCFFNCLNRADRANFCCGVRVSLGEQPSAAHPPM